LLGLRQRVIAFWSSLYCSQVFPCVWQVGISIESLGKRRHDFTGVIETNQLEPSGGRFWGEEPRIRVFGHAPPWYITTYVHTALVSPSSPVWFGRKLHRYEIKFASQSADNCSMARMWHLKSHRPPS